MVNAVCGLGPAPVEFELGVQVVIRGQHAVAETADQFFEELERIEGVVEIVTAGYGEHQPAAVGQQAATGVQSGGRVDEMFEHFGTQDAVEGAVPERRPSGIAAEPERPAGARRRIGAPRLNEFQLVQVQADGRQVRRFMQMPGVAAEAAAQIQHAPAAGQVPVQQPLHPGVAAVVVVAVQGGTQGGAFGLGVEVVAPGVVVFQPADVGQLHLPAQRCGPGGVQRSLAPVP